MTWHYQVIKYPKFYGLVEMFDMGKASPLKKRYGFTDVVWVADTKEELIKDLEMMLKDARKYRTISSKRAGLA